MDRSRSPEESDGDTVADDPEVTDSGGGAGGVSAADGEVSGTVRDDSASEVKGASRVEGDEIGDGATDEGRPGGRDDDSGYAPAAGETVTVAETATRRWYGIGALSLFGVGVGVLTGLAPPLLAGVFGIAFAGYAALASAPSVADVTVERSLDDSTPEPGEEVTVTVTVHNGGDRPLFDLRVVDGVPGRLGVASGTPRHGAALLSGATTTFRYAVRAQRGEHEFEPVTVVARDVAGANERVVTVGSPTTLRCAPELPTDPPAVPLRAKVSQFTGRFPGDTGGPGVEFHATRRYRRGDPLSRVDWRRTARTGEMTTVEYRVERTVRVVLVFDVRDEAHLAPTPHDRSAVERSVDGGVEAYASLTDAGHDVGIGAIGPTECWLSPGSGQRHRAAARQLFTSASALSPTPPGAHTDIYETTQRLKQHLSADAQLLLFTPLCDDRILDTAVRLDAHGYAVTVVTPDPTTDETTGQVYARLQRRLRISSLRSRAIPVVDWAPEEDLDEAIARTTERWSK